MQPCRYEYKIVDKEAGKELVVENNRIMSPKDLCTIEFFDKIIETGADAFKIEGRKRSPYRQGIPARAWASLRL